MSFKQKVQDAFNEQMNRELFSAHIYLAMAAWFENQDLNGFGSWLKIQAEEERAHAMKFYDFIISRGGQVKLGQIDEPPQNWSGPLAAFEEVLAHEEKITGHIHDLVDLAQAEKDHAAASFLQFFVDEQVEEEDTSNEIVGKLKIAGDQGASLFMLDSVMGGRTAGGNR